jgi:hypothetical protein
MMTFVGWIAIVGTFIMNDVFREQQKSALDDVNAAQRTFSIRQSASSNNEKIREVWTIVSEIQNKTPDLSRKLTSAQWLSQVLLDSIDNAIQLSQTLPQRFVGEEATKLKDNKEKAIELQDRITTLIPTILKINLGSDKDAAKQQSVDADNKLGAIIDESKIQTTSVNNITTSILTIARGAADHEQKKYEMFTWLSYALYAIGFLVALFAQLTGNGSTKAAEI